MYFKELISLITFFLLLSVNLFAQWSDDPTNNLMLNGWGVEPLDVANDTLDGIYISVNDDYILNDTIPISHPYLYYLDKDGNSNWEEPLGYSQIKHNISHVQMIPDGKNGVIICFRESNVLYMFNDSPVWDFSIRLQRIDDKGNKLWGDGVVLGADSLDQIDFEIASDENGGCYVSWKEAKNWYFDTTPVGYFRIQHISQKGQKLWGENGLTYLEDNIDKYLVFSVEPDKSGGVIYIATRDSETFFTSKINAQGEVQWETELRLDWIDLLDKYSVNQIITESGRIKQLGLKLPIDNFNKELAIDILSPDGEYEFEQPFVMYDSLNESFQFKNIFAIYESQIAFYWLPKENNSPNSYFQIVNDSGIVKFDAFGIRPSHKNLPNENTSQRGVSMVSGPDSNFYFIFNESDNWWTVEQKTQLLNLDGEIQWAEDLLIGNDLSSSFKAISLSSDDIIIAYTAPPGMYAQRVNQEGTVGKKITSFKESDYSQIISDFNLKAFPNPFNNRVQISFTLNENASVNLKIFNNMGQTIFVKKLGKLHAGRHMTQWNGVDKGNNAVSSGIYFLLLKKETNSIITSKTIKLILLK